MKDAKSVAIVGLGNRGRRYSLDGRETMGDKLRIVCVVDREVERSEAWLSEQKIPAKVYPSVDEMVRAKPNLDGVMVCTPENHHLSSFRAVADLKKPLLMEKPLEGSEESFKELVSELRAYPAPVLVGHCMRHAPILKKARQLIDEGQLGRVTSMRFVQNCFYGDVFFRGWHRRREAITSLYLEKATHDFDIMHMMNGDNYASSVFAFSKRYKFGGDKPNDLTCRECPEEMDCPESLLNRHVTMYGESPEDMHKQVGRDKCVWAREIDIHDDDMCLIEFSNGVQGCYIQTFYTPRSFGSGSRVYTVIGTEGAMEIHMGDEQGFITVTQRYGTLRDRMRYDFDYLGTNHYNADGYLLRNFYALMQGKGTPWTTVEAAVAAECVGLAAVKSVASRKLEPVHLI